MPPLDYAARSTRGARDYQEDFERILDFGDDSAGSPETTSLGPNGACLVAVLADGMGGHTAGALASQTVCDRFISAFGEPDGTRRDRLIHALQSANQAVADKVTENPILSGMGSTVVAAVFGPSDIEWVSVGDSPLLFFRHGKIAALNEDHSLAPELDKLAEMGCMTVEEAKADPRRHMLRAAVTGEELDLVDVSRRPLMLEPGDYVILASDGLHTLEPSEIERIIAAYGKDGAEAVAEALIREVEAMRVPHQDNTTVVAIRLLSELKTE